VIHVSHPVLLPCTCRCSNHPVPEPSAPALPPFAPLYHACVSRINLSSQLAAVGQGPTTTLDLPLAPAPGTLGHPARPPPPPIAQSGPRPTPSQYRRSPGLLPCPVPVCRACIRPDVARAPTNSTRHSANALLSTTARLLHPRKHRRPATHECLSVLSSVAATSDPLRRCHVTSRR
jgi:hypothetical protein